MNRAEVRRTAQLTEASAILTRLPAEGESLHAIMTGRYDLAHVLVVLLDRIGPAEAVRVATLSFNAKNLAELLSLLDKGKASRLTLLCSAFFKAHNTELWEEALAEFRDRGQRIAAGRSHAKIVCIDLGARGKWTVSGSANMRSNSNAEQVEITRAAGVHDFFASWIDSVVDRHEPENDDDEPEGG
jgi:hypothetical protein